MEVPASIMHYGVDRAVLMKEKMAAYRLLQLAYCEEILLLQPAMEASPAY